MEDNLESKPKSKKILLITLAIILGLAAVFSIWYFGIKKGQMSNIVKENQSSDNSEKSDIKALKTSGYVVSESNIIGTSTQGVIFFKSDLGGVRSELFVTPLTQRSKIKGSMSSDGKLIAYVDENGNAKIYNTESKENKIIKESIRYNEAQQNVSETIFFNKATISPDGKKIALNWSGWEWSSVALINSDGTGFEQIVPEAKNLQLTYFDWSPDSQRFVIGSWNNDMGGEQAALYVADASDPNHGKQILTGDSSKKYPDTFKDTFNPRWSPNGKKIAFGYRYLDFVASDSEKAYQYRGVYVINSDGSEMKQVTDNRSFSSSPFWLDDNTIIYSLSNFYSGDKKGIYKILLDGTGNTEIFSNDFNSFEITSLSADKKYLSFEFGNRKKSNDNLDKLSVLNLENKQASTIANGIELIGWLY